MAGLRALPGVTEVRAADHVAADVYADRGGPLIAGIASAAQEAGVDAVRRAHCRTQPGDPVSASHRKEPTRLNWKTFFALLSRDAHVARRNLLPMLLQNLLQPLLLTFVFGRVLTTSGMMQAGFKSVLLPGMMAISMILSGVQAVAMPLIAEFQFTREIEDRLLAPIGTAWLAVAKIVTGMVQALVAGLVVIPAAWLMMGSDVSIDFSHPFEFAAICLLVALCSAAGGLALGCSVGQTQIGLMFSLMHRAHDDVRLRVLSVVFPDPVSGAQVCRADQSAGVCQRRFTRSAGPHGAAHQHAGGAGGAGGDRRPVSGAGPEPFR